MVNVSKEMRCPPEMRGQAWTEAQLAKVRAVVQDYLAACDGQMDEKLALSLLHRLLAVDMPEAMKWDWGRLVRRWLRRWGLREVNKDEAMHIATSLHNAMVLVGCVGVSYRNLKVSLGESGKITPSFWASDKGRTRLAVTLGFVRLTAGQALVELLDGWELVTPEQIVGYKPPADAALVALVDSFWEAKVVGVRNYVGPHHQNLAQFGQWVKACYLTVWGKQRKLAYKLVPVTGWSTKTNDAGHAGCYMALCRLLVGTHSGWNLRTLAVLARFVGVPLEQLVRDYVAHRDGSPAA